MAHLPIAELLTRREVPEIEIREGVQENPGCEWYAIQCSCRIDSGCMPENEVPRVILPNCPYPGNLTSSS